MPVKKHLDMVFSSWEDKPMIKTETHSFSLFFSFKINSFERERESAEEQGEGHRDREDP